MNYISISYSHGDNELKITLKAIEKTLKIYKKALSEGIDKYLRGKIKSIAGSNNIKTKNIPSQEPSKKEEGDK